MIKVNGLDKYYRKGKSNEIHVINNTSLEFKDNGLVVLLGHSGCGKTTLINVIGGLDKAKGEIIYNDTVVKKYHMNKIDALRNKNVGYIFQNYNLLTEETVYDNLRIALNLYGVYDKDEISARIEYCLKAVNMFNYRKRRASALSGGQQQRIAIARALVKNPNVIIADEPTGNLDSANTIEIMNIIKKISKKCLVLLVTHEENIASFYADRIIRISDGKVVSDEENQNTEGLSVKDSQNIYLKDLNNEEIVNNEFVTFNVYSDDSSKPKINIDLIVKNGNIFINTSEKNVKFININSDVKLINDHYKEIKHDDIEQFDFDLDFFREIKRKRRIDFKAFGRELKESFLNFVHVRKRTKLMYFGFFILGMIIFYLVTNISSFSLIDISAYEQFGNDNAIVITKTGEDEGKVFSENDCLKVIGLDNFTSLNDISSYSSYELELLYGRSTVFNKYYPLCNIDNVPVVSKTGKLPGVGEIGVSEATAREIIASIKSVANLSVNDLVGFKAKLDGCELVISGIIEGEFKYVYLNSYMTKTLEDWKGSRIDRTIDSEYLNYKMVSGHKPQNENEVILNVNYSNYATEFIDEKLYLTDSYGPIQCEIVGYFTDSKYSEIYYSDYNLLIANYTSRIFNIETYDNYHLLEDYPALKEGECFVAAAMGKTEQVYKNNGEPLVVKGYFVSDELTYGVLVSDDEYDKESIIYNNNYYGFMVAYSENPQEFIKELNENGFNAYNIADFARMTIEAENAEARTGYLIVIVVLAGAIMIFTFFMMRSKLIHRIYNVGVYRALGANRFKIYRLFIGENLILTTFTSVLGYLIMFVLINWFNSLLPAGMVLFIINYGYAVLGVIALYLINVIFGLLPIYLLLKKTPSEILSKYDI